jgi:hypothetical protein
MLLCIRVGMCTIGVVAFRIHPPPMHNCHAVLLLGVHRLTLRSRTSAAQDTQAWRSTHFTHIHLRSRTSVSVCPLFTVTSVAMARMHAHTLLQVPRCTKDLSGSVVVRCVRRSRWHITLLARTSQHTRSPCVSHSQPVSSAVIVTTDVHRTASHDAPPCAYVDDVCSSSCVDATTVNN